MMGNVNVWKELGVIFVGCVIFSALTVYFDFERWIIVVAIVTAGICFFLYDIWKPTNYKKLNIDKNGIELIGSIGNDFSAKWCEIEKLLYSRWDDSYYTGDEEEIIISLMNGSRYSIPFEFPDRRRFVNQLEANLNDFNLSEFRRYRKSKKHGTFTLWSCRA